MSKQAEDLIYKMINYKNMRLGKNGSDEIKKHPFFKGVDWDNIREQKAPFIPELSSDYDTRYFEIFQEQEPFYPPLIKHPRRKDIQFIGFTYREDEDSNPTLNDEYNNAIQIVDDIKNIEDSDDDNDNNNNNVNNKEILVKKNSNGPLKKIKIENLKNYSGNNLKNSRNNSPILLLNKTKQGIFPFLCLGIHHFTVVGFLSHFSLETNC